MANTVYLNLMIDEEWCGHRLDHIFPVKDPVNQGFARALSGLGLYLCEPGDLLLVPEVLSEDFLSYVASGTGLSPQVRMLSEHSNRGGTLIGAAWSPMEAQLAGLDPENAKRLIENAGHLNQKVFLWKLALELGLNFPETRRINIQDGISWSDDKPWMLKANRSSGGSGLLSGQAGSLERTWAYVRRMSRADADPWLWQERIEREADFCLSGDCTNPQAKNYFRVLYGKDFSSWMHISLLPIEVPSVCLNAFSLLSERLVGEGYCGPFGVDGFVSRDGRIYPATDLNVRWEKSGLIARAAAAWGFSAGGFASVKFRVRPACTTQFTEVRLFLERECPDARILHFATQLSAFELYLLIPRSEAVEQMALHLGAALRREFSVGGSIGA